MIELTRVETEDTQFQVKESPYLRFEEVLFRLRL